MGILDITPSRRKDIEAFEKALRALGLSKDQFMRKLKKLGVSLGDQKSKTNYLNKLLRDAGKPELQYGNVISSKPSKRLTTKGKVEVGMGGSRPGAVGAPENAKIWSDGAKIQKTAIKKFPNSVTKQRKYFVDMMKKIYGKVSKKKILNLFKNTVKGVKSFSPIGIATGIGTGLLEEMVSGLGKEEQVPEKNKGGMMDINEMTRPIGYALGGPAGMTDLERTGYDRSKGYTENTNDLMRDIGGDLMGGIKSLFKRKELSNDDSLMIKRDQIIKELNRRVANQEIDPYKAAQIIDSITMGQRPDENLINVLMEKIVQQNSLNDFMD